MKKIGLLFMLLSLFIGEIYGVVMIQQAQVAPARIRKAPIMLAPSLDPNPPLIQLLELPEATKGTPDITQLKYFDATQPVLEI